MPKLSYDRAHILFNARMSICSSTRKLIDFFAPNLYVGLFLPQMLYHQAHSKLVFPTYLTLTYLCIHFSFSNDVDSQLVRLISMQKSLCNYSQFTMPFTDLLKVPTCKSTKPIVWNATLDLAFKKFKDLVCKDPSLLLPNPSIPF